MGDQLNGFTTAVWLSKHLGRPLRTCFEYDWITTPRLPSADCANLTRTMDAKPMSQFLMEREGTVSVGCDKCEKILPRLIYISNDVNRRYFRNSSFMEHLIRAERIVLRYNRNIVSFKSRLENRNILQSTIARLPPMYDMCVHYRSIRTKQRLDEIVSCSRFDPVVLFSDIGSSHLEQDLRRITRSSPKRIVYGNDSKSFLEMTRCKRFFIPASTFSIAAALTSDAVYSDILMYNNRNCTRSTPILQTHNMFFPP